MLVSVWAVWSMVHIFTPLMLYQTNWLILTWWSWLFFCDWFIGFNPLHTSYITILWWGIFKINLNKRWFRSIWRILPFLFFPGLEMFTISFVIMEMPFNQWFYIHFNTTLFIPVIPSYCVHQHQTQNYKQSKAVAYKTCLYTYGIGDKYINKWL